MIVTVPVGHIIYYIILYYMKLQMLHINYLPFDQFFCIIVTRRYYIMHVKNTGLLVMCSVCEDQILSESGAFFPLCSLSNILYLTKSP